MNAQSGFDGVRRTSDEPPNSLMSLRSGPGELLTSSWRAPGERSDRSRVRCRSCLRRVDLYLSFQRQKWRCFCQFVNCYYSFPSLSPPPAVTSHGAPVARVVPPRLRLPGHRHSSPCHIHRQATNLGQISCISMASFRGYYAYT